MYLERIHDLQFDVKSQRNASDFMAWDDSFFYTNLGQKLCLFAYYLVTRLRKKRTLTLTLEITKTDTN